MKYGTLYAYWTHEWSGDYKVFAKKAAKAGFDILEISAGDILTMSDREIEELNAVRKDLGLTITFNIGPAKKYDVASKDPETRKNGIKFLTDIMRKMPLLGSDHIVGVMYTYWPGDFTDLDKEAQWARGVESSREMGHVAQELGIDMCMEVVNRFETLILNTAEEGVKFVKEVDVPSVKLLLDTFHMNIEEDDMCEAFRTAGKYLGQIHVGEANRKLPGMGRLPWAEMGKTLRDMGYNGNVVMEPFMTMGGKVAEDIKVWRDLSDGATEEQMDENIKNSLVYLKKAFEG